MMKEELPVKRALLLALAVMLLLSSLLDVD